MSEPIRGQRPETFHKPPVTIVHAELFNLSVSALDSVDRHCIDQFVAENQTRDTPWPQFIQTVDPREEARMMYEGTQVSALPFAHRGATLDQNVPKTVLERS